MAEETQAAAPDHPLPSSEVSPSSPEPTQEAPAPKETEEKPSSEVATDPVDAEKKALDELKQLVAAAIANNEFAPPPPPSAASEDKPAEEAIKAAPSEPSDAPAVEEAPKASPLESSDAPAVEGGPKTSPLESSDAPAVEEAPKASPLEPAPVAEAVEKTVTVDEDGVKTVEAIEETVVSVEDPATEETKKEAPLGEETKKEAPLEEDPQKFAPESPVPPEEVSIWGVPLVGDDRSDTVLLKFLQAREFKVKDALDMIKNTVLWRKQFGIEALVEEDLGVPELNKTVYMHGVDKEGHPVCYNVYGEFQNTELYEKAFGDAEKRQRFLKWRIQYLEKGIREKLDFGPGGISSMVQITDLKNSPWIGKHRQVMNQAVDALQDNYPEFIAKKVFINVPWWNLAYYRMMSSVFSPRTKSKFVFAGPSKSAETLFKFIAPEQVPVAYGGLSKENDPDFSTADVVTEVTIKPTSKQSIEIPATEPCFVTWELRVLGWEVTYGAEFVPSAEEGYTLIVQKSRKLITTDEPIIKTSFKIGEPGKILLNFENPTSKKKKLLYRFKVKSSNDPAC